MDNSEETIDINDIFRRRLMSSPFRQGLFKEIGAGHSLLDCRKIVHFFHATELMLPKIDHAVLKQKLGERYEEIPKIHNLSTYVGELWSLADSFSFTKKSNRDFLGTREYRRYLEVVVKIMPHYPFLLEVYSYCLEDKNFSSLGIPKAYLFDFFDVLGKSEFILREGGKE